MTGLPVGPGDSVPLYLVLLGKCIVGPGRERRCKIIWFFCSVLNEGKKKAKAGVDEDERLYPQ